MALHLVKMAAGVGSVQELEARQNLVCEQRAARGDELDVGPGRIVHVTRFFPKRREEIILPDGQKGSLFWVFQGRIQVRQQIGDFIEVLGGDGVVRCGIVLEGGLVPVERVRHRAFQGWRYLVPDVVPRDLIGGAGLFEDMPAGMRRDLEELCLI